MSILSRAVLTLLLAGGLPVPGLPGPMAKGMSARRPAPAQFDCLPEGYTLADVVSYTRTGKDGEGVVTIKERLVELKARCKGGKLVDGKGREIRFFRATCYGNPPDDYEELVRKEREELEGLQKRFTVIVLACDPRIR